MEDRAQLIVASLLLGDLCMFVTVALTVYQSWKDSWESGTSLENSVDFFFFFSVK